VLNNRLRLEILIVVIATVSISAREGIVDPQAPRIRFDDPVVRAAMTRGMAESPTFRRIVERLAASDLIVYVERHPAGAGADGATQFVGSTPYARYVRIAIDGREAIDTTVGLLGHELRHALELAEAPWVINQESYEALYRSIGRASCGPPRWCFDTKAAVSAGIRVVKELRAARSLRGAAAADE